VGNRLSRLYTRTGDDGTTGLAGGERVDKDSARVAAIGTVDELNSAIGLVLTHVEIGPEAEILLRIQHQLFNLGGELSMPGQALLDDALVGWLEENIDNLTSELGPLEEFILPGGSAAAATCHLARGITRRAERELVALARIEEVRDCLLVYINRLSDLLFVLARKLNRLTATDDVFWDKSIGTSLLG
jgi:cob(I)alamin adenosyltransferase